ncbi:MAG: hypothetical protein KGJ23_09715 [Euryarchaeota archaeon]|nr:hypothetical protein [Euryarchaeota archaeon]MDE1836879.1 hypothetical protein [Euryarchaeota archaeon]MDE1881359.1 hypothetical protein [Euryarchaeota archaeon]MDE2045282.1 hypothetical protein [Thermoplasmata archaeon]
MPSDVSSLRLVARGLERALCLASLPSLRAIVREVGWRRVGLIAWLYTWVVMLSGEMLIVGSWNEAWIVQGALFAPPGGPIWDFPNLLVWGPGIQAQFPFLATFTMVIAAIGTGIGVVVAVELLRRSRRRDPEDEEGGSAGTAPTVAGTLPGIAGLSALGACCCVTCVGPSVVAVVAGLSAVTASQVLYNDWYVSLFQIAVIWLALIAQERAISQARACPTEKLRFDRRVLSSVLLRLSLIVAGITWSLAMFVEMGNTPSSAVTPALLYHWALEHQLLSLTAIFMGFFPTEGARYISRWCSSAPGRGGRFVLLLAGVSWGFWVPAPLVSAGLGGLINEGMGYLGAPASWGAAPPDTVVGPALLFHWAFQHALLSVWAIWVALFPQRASAPLLLSVPTPSASPSMPGPVTPTLRSTQDS